MLLTIKAMLSEGAEAYRQPRRSVQFTHKDGERPMSSIAKVIEVIAESEVSWEDAVKNALTEAAKTVEDIREIWVSSFKVIVEKNRIVRYRVTAKVTFVLKR